MFELARLLLILGVVTFLHPSIVSAEAVSGLDESGATTEYKCNFGMGKDEAKQHCSIPIPEGCRVVRLPGTTKPWVLMSKAGNTQCKFEEKVAEGKTRVIGSCTRCKTGHCSALFTVRADCSGR